jgi:hypothetical protein
MLRELTDAGVEFVVQVDAVDRRALDLLAYAVERLEQCRRVRTRNLPPFGFVEPHPECAQRGPEQAQRKQSQPATSETEASMPGRQRDPGDDADRKREAGQHPKVAERGKCRDAATIARAVVRAGMLAQADKVNKISAIHPTLPSPMPAV